MATLIDKNGVECQATDANVEKLLEMGFRHPETHQAAEADEAPADEAPAKEAPKKTQAKKTTPAPKAAPAPWRMRLVRSLASKRTN